MTNGDAATATSGTSCQASPETASTDTRTHRLGRVEGMEPEKQKTPWYKRWWVLAIAAVILIAALVQAINPDARPTAEPTPEPTVEATETPEPVEPTEAPAEMVNDLAERVQAAIFNGNPKCEGDGLLESWQDLCPTSPGYAVESLVNDSRGTVLAQLNDIIPAEERDQYGRWIMQMACGDVPDLETVIIKTADGYEHYWERGQSAQVCNH